MLLQTQAERYYHVLEAVQLPLLLVFNCERKYPVIQIEKSVTERFKRLQSVNVNTIIQNYKRIELDKMAKMLGITKEEVLKRFKSFGAVEKTESPWDSTIMNPLLKQKKKINVLIDGNVAVFDSQTVDVEESSREWQRYR